MAVANSSVPRSLEVIGYSGHLAEWTVAAALTKNGSGRDLSGPLTMQHTGLCSTSGPERKTGEMHLRLAWFSSKVEARLLIDGAECSYSGALSDDFTGLLLCPGSRTVPLTVWKK